MEAVYYAARANLQRFLRHHPDWTRSQLAQATGMLVSWIDIPVSCQRPTMMSRCFVGCQGLPITPHLDSINRWWIACWRSGDSPPENLGRLRGPKAIL